MSHAEGKCVLTEETNFSWASARKGFLWPWSGVVITSACFALEHIFHFKLWWYSGTRKAWGRQRSGENIGSSLFRDSRPSYLFDALCAHSQPHHEVGFAQVAGSWLQPRHTAPIYWCSICVLIQCQATCFLFIRSMSVVFSSPSIIQYHFFVRFFEACWRSARTSSSSLCFVVSFPWFSSPKLLHSVGDLIMLTDRDLRMWQPCTWIVWDVMICTSSVLRCSLDDAEQYAGRIPQCHYGSPSW